VSVDEESRPFRGHTVCTPYTGKEDSRSKRPVEAKKKEAADIVACNKKNLAMQMRSQSNGTGNSNNHAPLPTLMHPTKAMFQVHKRADGLWLKTGMVDRVSSFQNLFFIEYP